MIVSHARHMDIITQLGYRGYYTQLAKIRLEYRLESRLVEGIALKFLGTSWIWCLRMCSFGSVL